MRSVEVVITEKKPGEYDITLVNPTDQAYQNVCMLNGAFQSIDEDLLETNKVHKELGELPAHSVLRLSATDDDELDMVVWFNLDLYSVNGSIPEMYSFSIPRSFDFIKNAVDIPLLQQKGIVIRLEKRIDSEPIDEWVKHNSLEGRYTKYGDNKNDTTGAN